MCLRFVFLLITRVAAWLQLSRREEDLEDRRDLDPAPPARRPATAAAAPHETELGGPGAARDPARRDPESAAPRTAAAGHPGHHHALAPRHHPPPLGGRVRARQDRPADHPPEHQGPGAPAGPAEFRMGLSQDPRRTRRPGSEGSGVDGVGDSEEGRNRPRAPPNWAFMVAVPPLPGRGDPGLRLLHSPTCPAAPRPTSSP